MGERVRSKGDRRMQRGRGLAVLGERQRTSASGLPNPLSITKGWTLMLPFLGVSETLLKLAYRRKKKWNLLKEFEILSEWKECLNRRRGRGWTADIAITQKPLESQTQMPPDSLVWFLCDVCHVLTGFHSSCCLERNVLLKVARLRSDCLTSNTRHSFELRLG